MRQILLLGCGNRRGRWNDAPWDGKLTTLDIDPSCDPDVVFDLDQIGRGRKLPFPEDTFDEIHAYDVLEHFGVQGDYEGFFRDFSEFWRVMKPEGEFHAMTPLWSHLWAWGDPGHRRVFNHGTLTFLDQDQYKQQVGVTALCDYRRCYKADFTAVRCRETNDKFVFVLRAVKPSRIDA